MIAKIAVKTAVALLTIADAFILGTAVFLVENDVLMVVLLSVYACTAAWVTSQWMCKAFETLILRNGERNAR